MNKEHNEMGTDREPEFYDLFSRRSGAGQEKKPPARLPEQHADEISVPLEPARYEADEAPEQMAQTRLTDVSRQSLSGEIPELPAHPAPEPPVNPPRRPRREFHLRMEDELKRIPDYAAEGKEESAGRRWVSALARILFALMVLGISVLLSMVILFCVQEVFGFGKEDKDIRVEVPRNAGLSMVADQLEEIGVIRSSDLFKVYFKLVEPVGEFQYGTYELNSRMSYDEIISILFTVSTHQEEITVTIPEGYTLYQMAQRLEEKGVCSAEEFLQALDESDLSDEFEFLKELPDNRLRYHKLEGYLFPDTYNFYTDDDPLDVARRMLRNFGNKIADLEARMEELDVTLDQTIIIASIIQQEASRSEDMAMVSSVYWNRLHNEGVYPNLQADPTRKYAEELEQQMGSEVNQEILDAYDTYEGAGLPPGPICNPGYAAIEAALNPAESDYFYFCNNLETGEFFYATTLEQHQQNLYKAGLVQ